MRADTTIKFAGVDSMDNFWMEWDDQYGDKPERSFGDVIRALPRAMHADVAWLNEVTNDYEATERFSAIVDPERMMKMANGEDVDPLWHIPTDNYTIINPMDAYAPLETALDENDLSGSMFGEARLYRGGGEVHIDILFPEKYIDYQDSRVLAGITTGYDFFGQTTLYAVGYAQDTGCKNSMRDLTDEKTRKHVGEPQDFSEWWTDILLQIDVMTDHLTEIIRFAEATTMDFTDLPFTLGEFYENLGIPSYLAESAARDARARSEDPFAISLWDVHSGLTYALTHSFRGGESGSLVGYVQTANDLLMNPDSMVRRATTSYERSLEGDEADELGNPENSGRAAIERLETSIHEKRAEYGEFENRMERVLATMDGDDGEAPAA
ncbi:hypothetical protein [Halorubellus litoreus]|uniref:PAC2 family protein n=1 Tax=Halorubellus litoreus TaxID=755308 RepID=A0ABD5VE78_9EURY